MTFGQKVFFFLFSNSFICETEGKPLVSTSALSVSSPSENLELFCAEKVSRVEK